ncbi:MAG: protein translocase subunit SecD, partial [Desulfovibrio sp.]|nr:protein translocase subunit SecD [Desulfovibrio sp.]
MRGTAWRIAATLLVFFLSLAFALPSLPLPEGLRSRLPGSAIRLGLDLKGGISLTLGVDVDEALAASLAMTGQRLLRDARDADLPAFRRHGADRTAFAFRLARAADRPALEALCAKSYPGLALRFGEGDADGGLPVFASHTEAEAKRLKDEACDQALAVIRSRIDAFGVAEPDIRKQAGWRLLVQLPGISDPRRAVELIGRTARLEFCMVREDCDPESPVPPQGVRILPLRGRAGGIEGRIAVERDAALSGEDVADARPGFDERGASCVQLTFSGRGAGSFERLSADSVGRRMAIVLDGTVYSAPVIRERIGGGRCSITGGFTTAEAQDLAIALRSGSLAAPVALLEERS